MAFLLLHNYTDFINKFQVIDAYYLMFIFLVN